MADTLGVITARAVSGYPWVRVPPKYTFKIWIPRQMPQIGFLRSTKA